ncbi:hypothetical protein [Bradyrhizobium cytisi]|uniref:Uncharacterized protein n=1 Tax=Bradyrhizobium cytisi TaxID=515489 RepID=A0A5S4WSC7_9BRAD|nr:hypothetical protein [Bradyrhizobium cytisi]TYL83505.1 hypothetical protein FXB38_18280 [Bradyrhizobium cytisi]
MLNLRCWEFEQGSELCAVQPEICRELGSAYLKTKSQGSDARSIKTLQSQNSPQRQMRFWLSRLGLLQSKRLYPDNNDVEDDDDGFDFAWGMNRFIRREDAQAIGALHRQFSFSEDSIYGAMRAGSHQVQAIDTLNRDFGKTAYYFVYNPHAIPVSISYPLKEKIRLDSPAIGCRVLDADHVHQALAELREGDSPTYATLMRLASASYWRLETWAADLLLTCQVGEQFDTSRDEQVRYFLERRTGPIGAALAVSITLPDG